MKKLVLIVLASFATLTHTTHDLTVLKAFQEDGIVPKIIPKAPKDALKIIYETASADLGNTISPLRTVLPPMIDFDAKPNTYYTFMIIDPDVPSRAAPAFCNYLLTLYVNLLGTDLSHGFSLAPYVPPTPAPGSEAHRYVALVYEQPYIIDINNQPLSESVLLRVHFSVKEFAANHNFSDPIAGNFFYAEIPYNYESQCKSTSTNITPTPLL